jgi:hypothetical protein
LFWNKIEDAIARPFSKAAQVVCRARSMLLQKVLLDFGADAAFAVVVAKIKEHYGVNVASSTTRLDVEMHAQIIHDKIAKKELFVAPKHEAEVVTGQTDGSMIPIVTKKDDNDKLSDQRKNKKHEWKEARLALAKAKGAVDPVYAATTGSVDDAGEKLADVVKCAGEGDKTKIHCLGDGAFWIADQVDKRFGSKATFTLDFFHASEYLAQAATCCAPSANRDWMHEQQALLKESKAQCVLKNIQDHTDHCPLKENCPALKCFNYLSKRFDQLDYKRAIDANLPIGSGEIESAHRSIIQARLKIPGAWWTMHNAQKMLDLRTIRANGLWSKYWSGVSTTGGANAYG